MELSNEEKEYLADRDRKIHSVKVLSRNPWCVSVPSELLIECDTWILKPFQPTCKQGHPIKYVEANEK